MSYEIADLRDVRLHDAVHHALFSIAATRRLLSKANADETEASPCRTMQSRLFLWTKRTPRLFRRVHEM